MKKLYLRIRLITLIILSLHLIVNGEDPIKLTTSINYFRDLSDSFGGGSLLSGEVGIHKSWIGTVIGFGHFQSQPTYILKIPVPEINGTLRIPFEEITNMQVFTLSGCVQPIQQKWLTMDIMIGLCYNSSKSLLINGIDYSYDVNERKFTYLIRDYKLYKEAHLGYQIGINLSFYIFPKVGLQLSSRIQDLKNGGSFFFVGGGLCFKL